MTTAPEPSRTSAPDDAVAVEELLEEAAGIVDDVAETELEPQDVAAMDALDAPRRVLFVHAHPDDESIGNGATMARYAASAALVSLVTCTRGERGEVIPPELAPLEGDGPALALHRTGELAAAMEALGVEDHRFLDDAPVHGEDPAATAAVRYEDSGMVWAEDGSAAPAPDTPASAFARADLAEAAARLAGVLRAVRPQVVVTYEPGGGYGHPDHVMAHRVTVRAVELAEDPSATWVVGTEPWHVAKLYETVLPRSVARSVLPAGPLPSMVVDDTEVTTVVEAQEHLGAKLAALRAHASQVRLEGSGFRLSSGPVVPVSGVEHYRLVRGSVAPADGREDGLETDLFAGLAPGSGPSGNPLP